MAGRGKALIIASQTFADAGLRRLASPATDAVALMRVLEDPEIGGFEVTSLIDRPHYDVRQSIEDFFSNRKRDDLLLLYFSGHGVKDANGHLYLATTDTNRARLRSSSVESTFLYQAMENSLSRRQVLILDCCYSGAFARGNLTKSDDQIGTGEHFRGRGRVVLTASDAMQYAFEGDAVIGESHPSVFTAALVHGLQTGAADLDRNGVIDVDEWYEYAFEQLQSQSAQQRPGKWAADVHGTLAVARNPHVDLTRNALPSALQETLVSPLAGAREGAITDLQRLLHSPSRELAAAARAALTRLTNDDSRRVAVAASEALGSLPSSPHPSERGDPGTAETIRPDVQAAHAAPADWAKPTTIDAALATSVPDRTPAEDASLPELGTTVLEAARNIWAAGTKNYERSRLIGADCSLDVAHRLAIQVLRKNKFRGIESSTEGDAIRLTGKSGFVAMNGGHLVVVLTRMSGGERTRTLIEVTSYFRYLRGISDFGTNASNLRAFERDLRSALEDERSVGCGGEQR